MTISSLKEFSIYSDYCCKRNFLSNDECRALIDLRSKLRIRPGEISANGAVNQEIRKCHIAWIPKHSEHEWIYDKIISFVDKRNKTYFKYDIVGLELLQYTVYDTPDDHYNMHIDGDNKLLDNGYHRKLSFSVQISDPGTYEGSDLELWDRQIAAKEQGAITVFSSFRPHVVTPLRSGTRLAIVGWASGPPFR